MVASGVYLHDVGTILESAENERETKTAPLAIKDIVNSEIKI